MKKLLIFVSVISFAFALAGCKSDKVEPIDCAPGYKVSGETCVVDSNYVDPTQVCKAVNFEYDYDSLTYNLIWSDEFDGESLNDDFWTAADTAWGGGNNEAQYYSPNNVVVEDGLLKITALKEEYGSKSYTSGKIDTRYKGTVFEKYSPFSAFI